MSHEVRTAAGEPESGPVGWDDSRDATSMIATQAGMLKLLPLAELDRFLTRADELGPLLDPTGWRKHGDQLRIALRLVRATRRWIDEVQEALTEIKPGG